MAIVFDHDTATRCITDQGVHARFDMGPPCIDIAANLALGAFKVTQMLSQGSAATRIVGGDHLHPKPMEQTASGLVDVRA